MSPHELINGYVRVFDVLGSTNPGHLSHMSVNAYNGVVR